MTAEQINRALEEQKRAAVADGRLIPLGQVLVNLGFISEEAREQAVYEQIMRYRQALESANLHLESRVKERTKDLEATIARLGEMNVLKTNLVTNFSHELRTPLTQILGYIDLLSSGALGALSPEAADAVETIQNASRRLEKLIEGLLQFAMNEREGLRLKFMETSLPELCSEAIASLTQAAQSHQITIALDAPHSVPTIKADPARLREVIEELLTNAIKYTSPGGSVRLSVHNEDALVFLQCSDTGIGIAADKMGQLFEPFHQIDGSFARRGAGMGLGLTLARQMIQAHGSEILVESNPGAGTTFRIPLPVYFSGDPQ